MHMTRLRAYTLTLSILAALVVSTPSSGFVFGTESPDLTLDSRRATRWPFGGDVTAELQLGRAPSKLTDGYETFDEVFLQALSDWNGALQGVKGAPVLYYESDSTAPKVRHNDRNNMFFDSRVYGMAFPEDTPALTAKSYRRHDNGYSYITEADIIFNSAFRWDSYEGALKPGTSDFYRIALHEIGHFLGLGHPDQAVPPQAVDAVMLSSETKIAKIDRLQTDDTQGVRALYSLEPPGPPIGATASASGTVITANWNHPTTGGEPTGYLVEVGNAPGQSSRSPCAGSASLPCSEITGTVRPTLSLGGFARGTYYVRVKGVNWGGAGGASTESRVEVTGSGCTLPGTPTVVVLSNSGGSFTLGWTVPSGSPTSYLLLWANRSISDAELDASFVNRHPLGNAASAQFTDVTQATYYMRIRAENACGFGPASAQVVVVVGPPPTPGELTYAGQFDGSYTEVYRDSRGSCTWQVRFRGRLTLTLRTQSNGTITTGSTARITNSVWSSGEGAATNPGRLACTANSGSHDRTMYPTGTLADIRAIDARWRFAGRQNGNGVSGSLTAIRNDSGYTDNGTINVNLLRQ